MSQLLDDDDLRPRAERELTLSTGAILGIFFGLALVCALFFGFGYNMGRRSIATVSGASEAYSGDGSASAAFNSSKPSAGSPAAIPYGQSSSTSTASAPEGSVAGAPPHPTQSAPESTVVVPTSQPSAPAQVEPPTERPTTPPPAPSGSYGAGNYVVQVAAVSHQEDADLLVNALQRKGYTVAARNESGDKLVHIQVGPFGDRKQADAMKQRLVSDGYNAMIKQL